ncbi:MAG TPA: 50S ribosomal protein L22 [Patescibacteria group bacterium]|nr:50S ribosomal protein L22 [Patescibacteria group bacterium]
MDVHASLRSLRMSPRKVRLVIDAVRGAQALNAETQLSFMKQAAALPVLKLLRSAMANAEHNFHLHKEDLFIKTITADGGPALKRFRPRAFGRGAPIRKRTTHIQLVLALKSDLPSKPTKVKPAKKEKSAAASSNSSTNA